MPKRIDTNQPQIAADLRKLGFLVHITSDLGRGFGDIVVGDPRTLTVYLFEIKNPKQQPCKRKLRENQVKWHAGWRGQVDKIETFEEAVEIIKKKVRGENP